MSTEDYGTPTPEQQSWIGRLIWFCMTNRLVVALGVLFVIGAGLYVAPFDWDVRLVERSPVPTDAIPDIGENQQIVFTRWPGRSPQDVEDQITYPLTVQLLGVPGVRTVRSASMFGFSSIYVIFEDGVDFYWSRSRVLEKLNSLPAETLPGGVQPALGPDATALGQIFWYTLEGRDLRGRPVGGWDLHELRSIQDWQVRYALLSAGGVAEVASIGGFVREYQVDVDPDAMRAYGVTLHQVAEAVRSSNIDVGARTLEMNSVEYFIRSVGFIKKVEDIESTVVAVHDNVPVLIRHVATVTLGPALRRGVLDKDGAEAVGGVVVARYGVNPLQTIDNAKGVIARIADGLPARVVIDRDMAQKQEVVDYADAHGFAAYVDGELNHGAWVEHLESLHHAGRPGEAPPWARLSRVTVVPFYDRTGLIYETLNTLNEALVQQALITIVVVVLMMMHLRSSMLIGSMLPLAVLMTFVAMRATGVDANIVALSGIAIAIGTIVDMGIVLCENTIRHLDEAPPEADMLRVVHRAASEVGGAVLTAVATTVVSFLPVFFMTGSEGKLFIPLAWTKTFALIASVVVALTVIAPASLTLLARKPVAGFAKFVVPIFGLIAGLTLIVLGAVYGWPIVLLLGVVTLGMALYKLVEKKLPAVLTRHASLAVNLAVVLLVGVALSMYWQPLGPARSGLANFLFVAVAVGVLLGGFWLFHWAYPTILRWALRHKIIFLSLPAALVVFALCVWLGFARVIPWAAAVLVGLAALIVVLKMTERMVGVRVGRRPKRDLVFSVAVAAGAIVLATLAVVLLVDQVFPKSTDEQTADQWIRSRRGWVALDHALPGLGREFMPPLDEGSFLYMPTTMVHVGLGEARDILALQDRAIRAIPEVQQAVGKIGRVESPLDPAPVSMIETIITYKDEYRTDENGKRIRQWRDHIRSPDDIWAEINRAAAVPGVTTAPKLQPIAARIVMLQSGIRAPMAFRIQGPDLDTIEATGLRIEKLLQEVPGVSPATVFADRIVGKPYIEIHPDRDALTRYKIRIRDFQNVVDVAIGGTTLTRTVEGRERYPVRVRYLRELRDEIESLGRILIPGDGGVQVPLSEVADLRYRPGPQVIKSEDTFKTGYVIFDKLDGWAEVDVIENARATLAARLGGLPKGVSIEAVGTYRNQVRAQKTLAVVLPLALLLILVILQLQFGRLSNTLLVFTGIFVAWAGGFLLVWLYGQPWFLNVEVFGIDLRQLFQVDTVNLSVAVWVGFLALFGIATDDGVVMSTYLNQVFTRREPESIEEARRATVAAGLRRVRPCLMTTATTVLALLPILTSTGRGSDVMVPMAIPIMGGMLVELATMFVVPVLFCAVQELRLKTKLHGTVSYE